MDSKEYVSDRDINCALADNGWLSSTDNGRLMALELLSKASAGYRSSHTEEGFLLQLGLMKRDRTPNSRGRKFICSMLYGSSNRKPECFGLMQKFRK